MIVLKSLLRVLCFLAIASIGYAEPILQDINGQSTPFSSLKGQWVFINYWAEWCQSCIDEIPEFNRFYQHHKNDHVSLFAVNYDDLPLPEQKKLIKQLNISYPSLLTNPAKDLSLGTIRGVPVTFVFNPNGQLVDTLYGGQTLKTLDRVISKYQADRHKQS